MLKDIVVKKIRLKMLKENINQSKLARKLHCSNCALSKALNKKETLLKLENRLIQWLDGKEINFDDIGKNKNRKEMINNDK